MFWRFGGYANISTIDTLLDKPDVTLEELLDESDLIQELKSHNTKLIEFLREDAALQKLLEYVVAPKLEPVVSTDDDDEDKTEDLKGKGFESSASDDTDEKEKKRNRYAYVAAEILSSDSWSLSAALIENQPLLRKFWEFLKLDVPLDPLQASYFTKVNEALLDKKTEEMLELFKSIPNVVENMLKHVDCPMVMDLLLKIISLEKSEGGQGIVDWLHSQNVMPTLLSFLSPEHSWATQTSAGDFLKAIITISANASQNEQSCIGPNELTRQLVSEPCIKKLIGDMLKGGNPLTVGVGIVIEVIRKNNSDYDPDVGSDANTAPTSRDPIYLGTLLRLFAEHVPEFMALILSPNHTIAAREGSVSTRRKSLSAAFGSKIEPLGFDRFKTCELMAELLHCSNMVLLNEVGSDEMVKIRDHERDRLREEARLHLTPQTSRDTVKDEMDTSRQDSSSPGMPRAEVHPVSDNDGFEEVTHSGVLADDSKDDFDEKVEDFLTPTKPDTLSFLDKDDEDFVDEPLSSPRLNTEADATNPRHAQAETEPIMPLTPSKELSNQVGGLRFDEDTTMTSPPAAHSAAEGTEGAPSDAVKDSQTLETLENLVGDHPEKVSEGLLQIPLPSIELPTSPAPVEGLSPHPEDRPAPLFAKKAEPANATTTTPDSHVPASDTSSASNITEMTDSTMEDAGDVTASIMLATIEGESRLTLADSQPATVVGDYLKMQFVEHGVVPTILDFFFRFPWNNFLHNVVYDVVQQVFNGPMDRGFNRTLAIDLFETGDITRRIVEGQKASDEAQEKQRMRLGYMGHLTLIAEEVVKFTERHPPELLSQSVLEKVMASDWINYVEVTLSETRERDNAILGGVRPDMSVGPRQAVMNAVNAATGGFSGTASSALADAGLNGSASLDGMDLANGSNTSGSFGASNSLLSGFGSSSDEDDEEMEEDHDEDVPRYGSGADFSRYLATTTAASTGTELDPPLVPPPPPPLNVPPTKARRQLAARLALQNKKAAEAALKSNGGTSSEPSEQSRRLLNPFAAEEDDEEDAREDFTIGDIEIAVEGRGHLPPGTALTGSQEIPIGLQTEEGNGINDHSSESSASSSDDDDEDEDDFHASSAGIAGASETQPRRPRRLSTTQAQRRTSLEDDDEDEVVHVGESVGGVEDDGELIEILHHEGMQGIERV